MRLTAEEAARILQEQGYKAHVGEEYVFLDEEDIEIIYDEVVRLLKDEAVGTILELHRFVFIKTDLGYDVYVMIGEI